MKHLETIVPVERGVDQLERCAKENTEAKRRVLDSNDLDESHQV